MDQYAADEAIVKLERIAERRIREAIEAGEFDNLEGAGKPLSDLEDNPFVPEDMRVAFKVLQNSGYAPDWMTLAQEIEDDLDWLKSSADYHFRMLREELAAIGADPYAVKRLRSEMDRLRNLHRRASAQYRQALEAVNRKINTFNQTVPIASLLKIPLAVDEQMALYEDRVPAYLSYMK
ncbi:MAG TPA: DUF1992 domain-containing protein [Chloroflexia bacterium]|nr:DUF1992 domain-containing protein [Chloroflexia bacterium]